MLVADIFGYNALQVGLPHIDFLENNRMSWRFHTSAGGDGEVLHAPHAMPFASASLDLVLLPHVLEFSSAPHEVLREVERVLVPEGSVIITGINPFSLWGARRLIARGGSAYPWRGHFFSAPRIRDWLTLLGFETRDNGFGCYRPPVSAPQWLERWRFMDRLGARWWPICGGAYMLHGVKRVQGMRLIAPSWRDQRAAAKALSPVARRGRHIAGNLKKND